MNKLTSLFVMVLVVTAVFLLVNVLAGTIIGIVAALALFFMWSRYNRRAATVGLIDANLFAYFSSIEQGSKHQEALQRVVSTRYPYSEEKQQKVLFEFQNLIDALKSSSRQVPPEEEVQMLVYTIFCDSNGIPPHEYGEEILTKISDAYNRYQNKERPQ